MEQKLTVERINKHLKNNRDLKPTFNNEQNNQAKEQQGNTSLEQHYKPNRPNRHQHNTPQNNGRIYILLKCTWNILQGRSYVKSQKFLNKFKKIETIQGCFPNTVE